MSETSSAAVHLTALVPILRLQVVTNLRTCACMNVALAILGSVVAGPLRAAHGVDSLSDSLFVFFYLTVVAMVEARLWFLAAGFAARKKKNQIEGHGANESPDLDRSSVAHGQVADRPALVAVESGDVGDFRTASDAVAIAVELSRLHGPPAIPIAVFPHLCGIGRQ
jgi:hypothetical protein